jgi:hypothetical protein
VDLAVLSRRKQLAERIRASLLPARDDDDVDDRDRRPCACGCGQQARPNSVYASDAHKQRAYDARQRDRLIAWQEQSRQLPRPPARP